MLLPNRVDQRLPGRFPRPRMPCLAGDAARGPGVRQFVGPTDLVPLHRPAPGRQAEDHELAQSALPDRRRAREGVGGACWTPSSDGEQAVHAHLGMAGHGTDVVVASRIARREGDRVRAVTCGGRVADDAGVCPGDRGRSRLAEPERRLAAGDEPAVRFVGVIVDELHRDLRPLGDDDRGIGEPRDGEGHVRLARRDGHHREGHGGGVEGDRVCPRVDAGPRRGLGAECLDLAEGDVLRCLPGQPGARLLRDELCQRRIVEGTAAARGRRGRGGHRGGGDHRCGRSRRGRRGGAACSL